MASISRVNARWLGVGCEAELLFFCGDGFCFAVARGLPAALLGNKTRALFAQGVERCFLCFQLLFHRSQASKFLCNLLQRSLRFFALVIMAVPLSCSCLA